MLAKIGIPRRRFQFGYGYPDVDYSGAGLEYCVLPGRIGPDWATDP